MKSMCQEARRNSPSVAERRPASRWSRMTSRVASSSTERSSLASMSPFANRSRASSRAGGRSREPTWSARYGGVSRRAMGTAFLDRVVTRGLLDRDPAELGELLERGGAAEAAPARLLDAAERHLRLVVHGGGVDVADARLEPARDVPGGGDAAREDRGGEAVRRVVGHAHRFLG